MKCVMVMCIIYKFVPFSNIICFYLNYICLLRFSINFQTAEPCGPKFSVLVCPICSFDWFESKNAPLYA